MSSHDMVMKVTGAEFDVRFVGRRDGDPRAVASNARARAALHWTSKDLENIVTDAWRAPTAVTRIHTFCLQSQRFDVHCGWSFTSGDLSDSTLRAR